MGFLRDVSRSHEQAPFPSNSTLRPRRSTGVSHFDPWFHACESILPAFQQGPSLRLQITEDRWLKTQRMTLEQALGHQTGQATELRAEGQSDGLCLPHSHWLERNAERHRRGFEFSKRWRRGVAQAASDRIERSFSFLTWTCDHTPASHSLRAVDVCSWF